MSNTRLRRRPSRSRVSRLATLALLALSACDSNPRARPDPAAPGTTGLLGVQIHNFATDRRRFTVRAEPMLAGRAARTLLDARSVPGTRRFDPALGGDPEANVVTSLVVEPGEWRIVALDHDSGEEWSGVVRHGERTWLIVWASPDALRAQVETGPDSGPRFLE